LGVKEFLLFLKSERSSLFVVEMLKKNFQQKNKSEELKLFGPKMKNKRTFTFRPKKV